MTLLKTTGDVLANDWVVVTGDDALPRGGNLLVSPDRFHAARAELEGSNATVGLILSPEDEVEGLEDLLPNAPVLAITFPAFKDGRGFSQARIARQIMGYDGEIRAMGDIMMDQYAFLIRCGVDTVLVPEGESPEAWQAAAKRVSVTYQPAADGALSVFARRHSA